jgi:hypothetical protein
MERSMQTRYNTGFLSVQPDSMSDSSTTPALSRFESNIKEEQWSPTKILAREQLVHTLEWQTTQIVGEDLEIPASINPTSEQCLYVPLDLMRNTATQALLKTFTYYRCDFVVTITVNGTKFHQGMIAPFFIPLTSWKSTGINMPFVLNHTLLEANGVHTATIRIPFASPRSYLSTYSSPGEHNLGVLVFRVISALSAATGSATTLPITVSWHAENVEMYVPAMTPTNVLPSLYLSTRMAAMRVKGEEHSGTSEEVNQAADHVSVPAIGISPGACRHNPAFDSPESVRDILKRSLPLGNGDLVPYAFLADNPAPVTTKMHNVFLFGYMDAGAIFQPNLSMHPAAYWASMYAMGKGSLRYTFTLNIGGGSTGNSEIMSYGAVFLPGYINPLTYATAANLGYDPRSRDIILPGHSYSATPDSSKIARDHLVQPLFDAMNFIPRGYLPDELPGISGSSNWPQWYTCNTAGGAHVVADQHHNVITMDIPFVCKENAYTIPRYFSQQVETVSTQFPCVTNGAWVDDDALDVSNFNPATRKGGQSCFNTQDASFAPNMSPGLIVFYAMLNTNSTGAPSLGPRRANVSVFGSLGDDFRFGVLRSSPLNGTMAFNPRGVYQYAGAPSYTYGGIEKEFIPQFNSWGLFPNAYPTRTGTVAGEPHMFTFNTINNANKFDQAANVTLPTNVTGDRFDATATIPTTAMDKPSNTLGPNLIMPALSSPMPNSTGIVNAVRMGLRADETFTATPELFGTTEDEMDLCYLTRKMTLASHGSSFWVGNGPWDTAFNSGELLFKIPISPFPYADQYHRTEDILRDPPLISQISSNFLYWSGSLRYRFKIVASAFHTGRLFFAITYHPFRDYDQAVNSTTDFQCGGRFFSLPPNNIDEALNQGGVFLDLSEECRDITIDVPFKSLYPRLDVPTGFQPHQKSSLGTIACYVVNPLVAPETVAQQVDYYTFIGGGPDFHLHTLSPFAAAIDGPRPWGDTTGRSKTGPFV